MVSRSSGTDEHEGLGHGVVPTEAPSTCMCTPPSCAFSPGVVPTDALSTSLCTLLSHAFSAATHMACWGTGKGAVWLGIGPCNGVHATDTCENILDS